MKQIFAALLAVPLLLGAASAQTQPTQAPATTTNAATRTLSTDLRIYQNFAEVRQPVAPQQGTLTVIWPQSAWSGLIRDSLDLEGLPYTRAVHQTQGSWLENMEGREVVLYEDGREPQTVTLVRARDILIRDAQGLYRRVDAQDLALPELPPESGYGALPVSTFTLAPQASGTGVLSYLTRSVSWTPRYTLTVGDSGAQLSALADITNGTELAYEVGETELLAGDVNLNNDGRMYRTEAMYDAVATSAPASAGNIVQQESLNGIYRYALDQTFSLPASSTVTLPFMTPKVQEFEGYVGLNRGFSESGDEGVLERYYRFKSDRALPGGGVTVREQGRVTGQTRISETAPGRPVDFSLGRDPEVSYVRSVKTVSRTARSAVFEVTYLLKNSKKQPVRAEIKETVYNDRAQVKGEGVTQNGNQASFEVTLPAGGEVTRTFTVTIPQQ